MKFIYAILTILFANVTAFAQGFNVKDFTVDVYLNPEGYFDVSETYDVVFTDQKHGIFREIVTDYKFRNADDKIENRKIIIQNIEVPAHPSEISSKLEQRADNKIKIKIGDKDKLVTGPQHYEIRYRVYNAFLFDQDKVQFYWNIKPQGWAAIFEKINFNIHTPEGSGLSAENCFVYAGLTGTSTPSTDFDYTYSNGVYSGKSHPFIYSIPGQDVTVLIKLPKNLIQENFITIPWWQQYGWVAILIFLLMAFGLVWLRYGKDDKVITTTSYYPPEGMDPAMAGYLINDKDDASDLIALIPYWAAQGFITIEEIPKIGIFGKADMKLTRINNIPATSPEYEQQLFSSLFGIWGNNVLVSSLRNSFYVTMNAAQKELNAKAQKYYEKESRRVMKITMVVAIVSGVLLCILFLFTYGILAAVLAPVTCVFIAFMSFFLQKKNSKGNAIFFGTKRLQ